MNDTELILKQISLATGRISTAMLLTQQGLTDEQVKQVNKQLEQIDNQMEMNYRKATDQSKDTS